jgi:hypothetical protein
MPVKVGSALVIFLPNVAGFTGSARGEKSPFCKIGFVASPKQLTTALNVKAIIPRYVETRRGVQPTKKPRSSRG